MVSRLRGKVRWSAMLGTAQLETIIHDNSLPAVIKERGQTWLRVRLAHPQTGLSETLSMGLSDFADLILHWRPHGRHVHPFEQRAAGPRPPARGNPPRPAGSERLTGAPLRFVRGPAARSGSGCQRCHSPGRWSSLSPWWAAS